MCRGYVSTSCNMRHNKVYFNVTQKAKKSRNKPQGQGRSRTLECVRVTNISQEMLTLGTRENLLTFLTRFRDFYDANWKTLNFLVQVKLSQCVLSMLLRKHNLEAGVKRTGNTSKDIFPPKMKT